MLVPDWQGIIDERPQEVFRVRRDIFTDPAVFERELKTLFEGGWIYLAHECQVPNPHDYVTTYAGRRPIVLMRDARGELHAFYNACPHRGMLLCPLDRGNAALHVCPYHSWTFSSEGRNKAIKAKSYGGYTDSFLSARHDMVPIAQFESYRGFLFGSLSADVPTLSDYLGDARLLIDLTIDQSAEGLEFVPGVSTYTYNGNWKYQLENCSDGYHVSSTHPTYVKVARDRAAELAASEVGGVWARLNDQLAESDKRGQNGSFSLGNGHVLLWSVGRSEPGHPLFGRYEELVQRVGPVKAKWMFYARNLTIFPNLQIAENVATQVRAMRPLSPQKTEMTTYCAAPRGEEPAARQKRLRQYEDFFMPSGMATPDDLVVYEGCQASAASDLWQSYDRGMAVQEYGQSEEAQELGIKTVSSTCGPPQLWDETLMQAYYLAWSKRMASAEGESSPSAGVVT